MTPQVRVDKREIADIAEDSTSYQITGVLSSEEAEDRAMPLQVGDQFDQYQIRAHFAEGGTGNIYRAVDIKSGQEVALKIPHRETILDPRHYEYFLREQEALNALDHPAVQRKVKIGRFNNTPFFATNFIDGDSLRSLIKHNGALACERAIALVRKIAACLTYCHEQGVVHRDLKPENIIITIGDWPVIIDFGLALSNAWPRSGKAAGTPDYMAPEQVQGEECDKRTDVYSLGIIFYEMLAGEPPFTGEALTDVMNKRLYEAAPRLDKAKPDIPLQVATVVAKCLQRDPDQRYSDMAALCRDLENLEQVDVSQLDNLTVAPKKPSFFKTQSGQVILTLFVMIGSIVLLTILLVAVKH